MTALVNRKAPKIIIVSLIALGILGSGLYYATIAGMYKGAAKLLMAKWFVEWKMDYPTEVTDNNCSAGWSPAVNGEVPYMLPLYPEVEAAYWMMPMSNDREVFSRPVAYRLQGEFPYARYMSFHTYNAITGDYVATVKDVNIEADAGSINPYLMGVRRDKANRKYTLWVVPEGSTLPQISGTENVVTVPRDVKFSPTLLRVYRADLNVGLDGGVGLPQMHVFDAETGEPVNKCAPLRLIAPNSLGKEGKKKRFDRRLTVAETIHHYRSDGAGFYPNAHNSYLVTELERDFGDIALLKWKAPTTPNTKRGGGVFSHKEDLRYWSFCLNGDNATNTSYCLVDDEAKVDANGYVTAVVGPDDEELRAAAEKAGLNYIPWGIHHRPITILRHMAGEREFEFGNHRVPPAVESKPFDQQRAEDIIGDYSPTGYYCSPESFLDNYCGIKQFRNFKNTLAKN